MRYKNTSNKLFSETLLQLQQDEKILFRIFDTSPDAIAITDISGNVIVASKSTCDMFLYENATDIIGHSIFEFIDSLHLEKTKAIFEEMLQKTTYSISEHKALKSDGTVFDIEVNGNGIKNKDGVPTHIILIITDISERKAAEKKILFQNRLQELFINISTTYINLPLHEFDNAIDKSLRELGEFVNADRFYIFDYNYETQTTTNTHEWCADGIDPQIDFLREIPLHLIPEWTSVHEAGETLFIPNVQALPENNNLRMTLEPQGIKSLLTVPIMDGDENTGFIGFDSVRDYHVYSQEEEQLLRVFAQMILNVRKRLKNEITLKLSEQKYKVLFDDSPDAYFIMDGGIFIECNKAAEKITGYEKLFITGKSPAEFSPEYQPNGKRSSDYAKELIDEAFRKGKNYFEWTHLRSDGTEIITEVNLTIINYKDKNVLFTSWRDITSRKLTEEEYRKFRIISDQANYGNAIAGFDNKLTYVNETFAKMHGYTQKELIGKEIKTLHNKEQLIKVNDLIGKIKTEGGFNSEVVWHTRKDGSVFPTLMNSKVILDKNNHPRFMSTSLTDITEQITSQRKIEEQNTKLNAIIDAVPDLIFISDKDGNYVESLNKKNKNLLYPSDKIVGANVRDVFDAKTTQLHLSKIRECIETKEVISYEYCDSKNKKFFYDANVVYLDENHVLRFVRDITLKKLYEQEILDLNVNLENKIVERTLQLAKSNQILLKEIDERKIAEKALSIKTQELENFFSVALDLLCIADTSGKFIKLNKAWENILGYTVADLENMNFIDFIHPDDLQQTFHVMKLLEEQNVIQRFLNRYKTKEGNYRFIEWNSVPVGKLIYAAARDMTDQIIFQQQLQQNIEKEKELNELKSRFVSIASHEFRNPLSTILMTSETLMAFWHKLDDDEINTKLNKINNQVLHLDSIVSNVMQVSKIQEGKVSFKPEKKDFITLCKDIISNFNTDDKLINKIHLQTDFEHLPLLIDERLMIQAVQNLISNALKYSQPNPVVQIRIYENTNEIIFSIQDNGIGIPEKDQKQLFQAFYRAGNVSGVDGNGLGLNIVKESVRLHGGTINFESKENKGSIFYIHLPRNLFVY